MLPSHLSEAGPVDAPDALANSYITVIADLLTNERGRDLALIFMGIGTTRDGAMTTTTHSERF